MATARSAAKDHVRASMTEEELRTKVNRVTHFYEQKPMKEPHVLSVLLWLFVPLVALGISFWAVYVSVITQYDE